METKYLYLITLCVTLLVAYFYKENEHEKQVVSSSQSRIDYTAKNIHLVQTDATGLLSSTLNANNLQHYRQNDRYELTEVQSTWFKAGKANALLSAKLGSLETGLDGKRLLQLSQQVQVNQLANSSRAPVSFKTESLQANPDQKTVYTDQLVTFTSRQGNLVSQGIKGDLNTGQYEFNQVRGRYAITLPPVISVSSSTR